MSAGVKALLKSAVSGADHRIHTTKESVSLLDWISDTYFPKDTLICPANFAESVEVE